MRRRLMITAPLMALCLLCAACKPAASTTSTATADPAPVPSAGSFLNIGIKTYQPGLDLWTPGQDNPRGFEWSMINSIFGQQLGYRIRSVPITSDDWEQELSGGEISVAVGSISYDQQRSQYLFAGPYMIGQMSVLTLSSSNVKVAAASPLKGQTVCYVQSVQTGNPTTAQQEVKQEQATTAFQVAPADSTDGCLQELDDHDATVFFSDAAILRGIAAHSPAVYTVDDLNDQFGPAQDYMITFAPTAAMSALCTRVDKALSSAFLGAGNSWWNDFAPNLGGSIGDQGQIEDAYEPAGADIDQSTCQLGQ